MTSQIQYSNIDALYPIAGQDNDSQGFRDNFSYIKAGLQQAYSEISDLQDRAILKSADAGSLNNDMGFSQISNVLTSGMYSLASIDTGPIVNTNIEIDFQNQGEGYFQYIAGATLVSTSISFINWPVDPDQRHVYTKCRVEIKGNGLTTVSLALSGSVKYISGFVDDTVTIPATGSVVFDVWSVNGGSTIYYSKVGEFTVL